MVVFLVTYLPASHNVDPGARAVYSVGLQPLAC